MLNFMCMLMRAHVHSHRTPPTPTTWTTVGVVIALNVFLCLIVFMMGYMLIKSSKPGSYYGSKTVIFFHKCEGIILIIVELLWLISAGKVVVSIEKSINKCYEAACVSLLVQMVILCVIGKTVWKIGDKNGNRRRK